VSRWRRSFRQNRRLMESLFIGVGARHPDRVELDVHQVL
jgi:hypothetical protein